MHLDLMRDRANTFPVVEDRDRIRYLRVWHCKYRTLAPITEFPNVEELVIASFPDESLQMISSFRKLRYLRILHMPKVTRLDGIAGLPYLETLSLETSPSWDASCKCTVVESLDPVAGIPHLRHLQLFGICPPDKSLAALDRLKSLESAQFSQYPQAEVDRFHGVLSVVRQNNPVSSFR